jgi:hypothetical protein
VVFVSGGQQRDRDGGSGGRVIGLEVERFRRLPEMISVSVSGERWLSRLTKRRCMVGWAGFQVPELRGNKRRDRATIMG